MCAISVAATITPMAMPRIEKSCSRTADEHQARGPLRMRGDQAQSILETSQR